jgi:hypothetical protein
MISKNILLEAIYNKTGVYITTKNDCRAVSQFIATEKIGFLSESTLYRFFLYNSNSNKPYKNTFNVLARFCGYPDWNAFLKYYDSNYLFNEPKFLNKSIAIVIENFVVNENFKALIEVFDTLENENYKTKEFFGIKTFLSFNKTNLFPQFIKVYGHHSFVRNILIEALYDPHHRIDGYAEGIENYILTSDINSENYIQDLMFAKSVLFRHYYLTGSKKAEEYGKKLYEETIWDLSLKNLHVFPKTRLMTYKFWFLDLKSDSKIQHKTYSKSYFEWMTKEIQNTNSIIEINIIYQTATEVFQNLNLKTLKNKVRILIINKINNLQNENIELKKLHNANGILNLLPL